MAAKIELEAYVNGEHPFPQYLRHHISSYSATLAKQLNIEGTQLASDGFPDETAIKAVYSSAVNGHPDSDIIDNHSPVESGKVLHFILSWFMSLR